MLDIKLDILTLGKGAETLGVNRRLVNENIGRSVTGGDEAEALHNIEEFYPAGSLESKIELCESVGRAGGKQRDPHLKDWAKTLRTERERANILIFFVG